MTLNYTKEQGQILINLLDVATKAGGLQVSEACLFFVKSIQAALQAESPAEPKIEEAPKAE